MHTKLQIKLLNKTYNRNFKKLYKKFFADKNTGLFLFVEYLKYLKDTMLTEPLEQADKITNLNTVTLAIAEFEAYVNYRDYSKKSFHWNNFCELIKQNMEEWLQINDSV